MKLLVFDIGGTAIKYGIWENGQIKDASEVPTQAWLGGRHIMDTVIDLAERINARLLKAGGGSDASNGGRDADTGGHLARRRDADTDGRLARERDADTDGRLARGRDAEGGAAAAAGSLCAGFCFDGIGVSTAGQVNTAEGSILYANENIPGYTGFPVRRVLEARFGVPVAVENDVNSAAVGEAVYGAAKDIPSFLCLTYGTGIGGAIIENGTVYHGCGWSAAEFGSIVTHAGDKIAGRSFLDGCYERFRHGACERRDAVRQPVKRRPEDIRRAG